MLEVKRTVRQLAIAQDNESGLFASPDSKGNLNNYYWASTQRFIYDVCVATVQDFVEAQGYDSLDIDQDYLDTNEEYVLEVAETINEL